MRVIQQFVQDEGDRQLTILALATLARERPGFDIALSLIADSLHGKDMYEKFKEINADRQSRKEPMLPHDIILEEMKRYLGD